MSNSSASAVDSEGVFRHHVKLVNYPALTLAVLDNARYFTALGVSTE